MNTGDFSFSLPRYKSLPDVGLYLDQVVRYVNDILEPLDLCITASMISNYVKKGYIDRPSKKLYFADQIAYIIFIVISKQVLSMENIVILFDLQKETYKIDIAYDTFCSELEEMLNKILSGDESITPLSADADFSKKTLRSVVLAISHIINLNYYFKSKS